MPQAAVDGGRLDSWKSIASYLGKNERTVIRWEKERGLPIHRIPGGQRHGVFAYRNEIDVWLRCGIDGGDPEVIREPFGSSQSSANVTGAVAAIPTRNVRRLALVLGSALALGAAIAAILVEPSLFPSPAVHFKGIVQITRDSYQKSGLVTDGKFLYFGEWKDGKSVLSKVPIEGGTPVAVPIPSLNASPEDISPDGKKLLVLLQEGMEEEHPLWIVPAAGGQPQQVGTIRCHSAAWSPDGTSIAFAAGHAIYSTRDFGESVQKMNEFAGVPFSLQWSLDGSGINFELADMNNGRTSLWELNVGRRLDKLNGTPFPLGVSFPICCQSFATLDRAGQMFFAEKENSTGLRFLKRGRGLMGRDFTNIDLDSHLTDIDALAIDRTAHKLFALVGGSERANFLRYDQSTHAFRPFLPGVSGNELAYSPDGRWVSYVSVPDAALWVSRTDGSDRHQIDFRASAIELPRWSPDGRRIAFMARLADKPWRIYIVSPAGEEVKEASIGTDNQGAPTWSPDGGRIVYGNVKCQEPKTCAIHMINLATGKESAIPGSQGMATARWSPDGRFVASLYPERHQVYLLDIAEKQWRKLADHVNGNDLSWSADSGGLYASNPSGNQPEILRISIKDGTVNRALDLSSFSLMAGQIGNWFTLSPDGSIILPYRIHPFEVYALDYGER